jgi:hypothetical protein
MSLPSKGRAAAFLINVGAVVVLAFSAVGVFQLRRFGVNERGALTCMAAMIGAFSLSIALYVFHLRRRIEALERAVSQSQRPES